MRCSEAVLRRHEDILEGPLDHRMERPCGPMLRVELAPLDSAQFRTTRAGGLQLHPDLTPRQRLAATRRHGADRGDELG